MSTEDIKLLGELKALETQGAITTAEATRIRDRIVGGRPRILGAIRSAVELGAKVAWPVLALVALAAFYGPLREKISESEEIRAGSLVLKIQEKARSSGNPELAALLGRLSPDGVELLMNLGDGNTRALLGRDTMGNFTLRSDIPVFQELERNGLFAPSEPIDRLLVFFWSVKPDSATHYYVPEGMEPTAVTSQDQLVPTTVYSVSAAKLTPEQASRLDRFSGSLTAQGKKAFELITQTVSDQLTACKPASK